MKTRFFTTLFLCFAFIGFSQSTRTVKGKVTDGKNPIENVNISILEKNKSTTTDANGKYEISAETNDILQFSYAGMKTIQIQIEDVTRILNPIMVPDITELDEVIVKGSNRKSQAELAREYNVNESLIKTAYGIIDAETSPGQVRFLQGNQINDVSLCILNMLRNRFPGVTVFGDCINGGSVAIRGFGSITNPRLAIYDVDGVILTDTPIWLVPSQIKRVAILNSLAMTTRYGNIGGGGVIVINTKAGSNYNTTEDGKPYDFGKLRNNYADGKELTRTELDRNAPNYLKELRASESFEAAKATYEANVNRYGSSPYYFLDAYRYFYERWNEGAYADAIIEENYGLFENNPVLLKALAYNYEAQERFEMANKLFKEIFILRPNYAQSYLDVANSYRDIRKPKQAAAIYARYEYLLEEGFMQADTMGFHPIIEREFNNLLMLQKNAVVDSKASQKLFVAEEDFKGTRLVFEWNDSEAEFELQFVSPENQYYKWKHSLADNAEVIMAEKRHGYACTEYLIDGSMPGKWKINVNYLGNKSLSPTYLKATIYHDYGSRYQRKEVKVFKLNLKNVNQELFAVQKSSDVVVR